MAEGETMQHFHNRFSDYLGVSVKIMKTVYNRYHTLCFVWHVVVVVANSIRTISLCICGGGSRNDLHQKHKGTLKAANSGKVIRDHQAHGPEAQNSLSISLNPTTVQQAQEG